jgi:hypothetical protein
MSNRTYIYHLIPEKNKGTVNMYNYFIHYKWEEYVKVLIRYLIELDPKIRINQINCRNGKLKVYTTHRIRDDNEIRSVIEHCAKQCQELTSSNP